MKPPGVYSAAFEDNRNYAVKQLEIAFIGAGNMASSIIGGLLEQGIPGAQLRAADPFPGSLEQLRESSGIATSSDNNAVITGADVIILAVKPQVMNSVLADIRGTVTTQQPLVISIAAGITIASIEQGLGDTTAIVRCMPNTPALLQAGATALFANPHTRDDQVAAAEQILAAVGTTCWVDSEDKLDAVTALSGSGPAYFFLFMEAMSNAGEKLGLDAATSRQLAIQTGLGACRMAAESEVDLLELRRRVTSPGGTTQAAVESFEEQDLRGIIATAMQAALDRAQQMAREMG
jgi:pyrroline-5-carboxylate reductase